jgi:hypothetical protein
MSFGESLMRFRIRFTVPLVALMLSLLLVSASDGSQFSTQSPAGTDVKGSSQSKSNVVYVCACLKTKSCSCMTESKMEGPCACGTEGGPPMKEMPSDSKWAKKNRDALAN